MKILKGKSVVWVWEDAPNDTRGKLQVKLAAAKLALVGASHFVGSDNVGKIDHIGTKTLRLFVGCYLFWCGLLKL
jgi:hypothetical protein